MDESRLSDTPIRILLIDDDEDDYVLTRDLLGEIRETAFALDWIADEDAAVGAILEARHDLYLIDYRLARKTGIDIMKEARSAGSNRPMILLTGLNERALDFEAMRAGAADYLEKGKLDAALLERAIRYTLQQKRHADELERKVQQRTAELARANLALQAEVIERKRAETALRETDRRKDEYLASLAHELRNPLVPIRFALEIMRMAADRPELLEKNRLVVERQIKHMVRLIDDLMDVSRLSRGKIVLHRRRVDLAQVIEDAVEASRPLIESARHTLAIDRPDGPIQIDADPVRLAQILLNLLNNAAKFTEPGGFIQLSARQEGDWILLQVRDNGAGIAADEIPRLFQMFAQLERPTDQAQGGLGIGLALVRNLVELHGGEITASSDGPERGSTFSVRLPLRCDEVERELQEQANAPDPLA